MPPRRANALGVGSAETPGAGSEFVNESPDRAGRPRRPQRKARRRVIAGGYGEEEQRSAAGCIGRLATGGDSFTDSLVVDADERDADPLRRPAEIEADAHALAQPVDPRDGTDDLHEG